MEVNDLSSGQYSVNKDIRYKTSIRRSDLCDYSDTYIVVKGRRYITATANADMVRLKITLHLDHA